MKRPLKSGSRRAENGRLLIALALGLVCAAVPARAIKTEKLPGVLANKRSMEVVSGQALVKFNPSVTGAKRTAALESLGMAVTAELAGGWAAVSLPPGMKVSDGLILLKGLAGVQALEPSPVFRPLKVPNDPLVPSQYHLSKINAFAAWDYDVGSSSRVTVAVVDTGIDGTHPDLSSKLISPSKIFAPLTGTASNNQPPTPACNHATRVSGTAAASSNNGLAVAGVSWGAQLLSLKVFQDADCTSDCSDNSPNSCGADPTALNSAIAYATSLQNTAQYGHIVLNISLGGTGACPSSLQTAITNAVSSGVVIVAAAGNDGSAVNNPANCAGVIPVGAVDSNDAVTSFSSRGPEMAANGLVAPGVNIVTTDVGGGTTGSATGTSFASPIVAGAAALILSAKPSFTPASVQSTLRSSADNIGVSALGVASVRPLGNAAGAGRLDAFRALRLAVNGTLAGFDGDQKTIAFPNPFRPATHGRVTITVPSSLQGGNTDIKIYTMDGQFVRTLVGLTWDGKNESGADVATGVYIFRVKTDNGVSRGRVALIR